jgi:hypothetical protein
MWWKIWLIAAIFFGSLCLALGQTQSRKVNDVSAYMKAKLTHSQKVLEGLTVDDLPLVAKHAQEMSLLSMATNWEVLQTSEYSQRSQEFQRTATSLRDAAKNKNLDGAALAYVELTMKCIDCHKYVRNVRMAKLDAPERATKP